MKVLIADDSTGIRAKLRRYLEEIGHTIVGEAGTGRQAFELFGKTAPELVTLDIVMPEMDGLHALSEIMKANPQARVVMITSAATVANMFKAKEMGAIHFMVKPFQKQNVIDMMVEVERLISDDEEAA